MELEAPVRAARRSVSISYVASAASRVAASPYVNLRITSQPHNRVELTGGASSSPAGPSWRRPPVAVKFYLWLTELTVVRDREVHLFATGRFSSGGVGNLVFCKREDSEKNKLPTPPEGELPVAELLRGTGAHSIEFSLSSSSKSE